jgi:ankyrin repeat protein
MQYLINSGPAYLKAKTLLVLFLAILISVACSPSPATQDDLSNRLFRAASDGNVMETEHLLKAGANVNVREVEGETPLMYAATAGKTEVVNLLLDRGAEVEALSSNRETALARAVGAKQYDCVTLLLDRGAKIDRSTDAGGPPLIYAAGGDDLRMVKQLLHRGANVNSTDDYGNTALIAATSSNVSAEIVRVILTAGADPNHKNQQGESAYDIAVRNRNQALAELLKNHRPKP